jgi:hypothetical protein
LGQALLGHFFALAFYNRAPNQFNRLGRQTAGRYSNAPTRPGSVYPGRNRPWYGQARKLFMTFSSSQAEPPGMLRMSLTKICGPSCTWRWSGPPASRGCSGTAGRQVGFHTQQGFLSTKQWTGHHLRSKSAS